MDVFASWSGGKDSALALNKALKAGHRVSALLNFLREDGVRSRSHGVRSEALRPQAEAMGVPIVQVPTSWAEYEARFKEAVRELKALGVEGGIFGDIELREHRDWVERVCGELGITPLLPLWGASSGELFAEMVASGFKAVLVATRLDESLIAELRAMGAHPFGENGEYHTFVVDGPLFRRPLRLRIQGILRDGDYRFLDFTVE